MTSEYYKNNVVQKLLSWT